MKQIIRYLLPAVVLTVGLGIAWSFAGAQPREMPPPEDLAPPSTDDSAYEFKLGEDITAQGGEITIEPSFRAVADDRFPYDIYVNTTREGVSRQGDKALNAFHREENWITWATLVAEEDPLEGNTDLLLKIQFDQMAFRLGLGKARYTGTIVQEDRQTGRKPVFHEILPDGTRNEVNNIPGWPRVTARNIEGMRFNQSHDYTAAAWVSVDETGRIYDPTYFAEFETGDQSSYPGRLQDPVALMGGLLPVFHEDEALKIGQSTTVRRGFPMGVTAGSMIEYEFTCRLTKLYGTLDRPTAARFTFEATPVTREHTSTVNGLTTRFTAPDITGGELIFDLNKGIAAYVAWKYALKGTVSEPGSELRTEFEVKTDFSASLRVQEDAGQ